MQVLHTLADLSYSQGDFWFHFPLDLSGPIHITIAGLNLGCYYKVINEYKTFYIMKYRGFY